MKEQLVQTLATAIQSSVTEYKGVKLPSPQRTGTSTQQRTYAVMKARELVDANPELLQEPVS